MSMYARHEHGLFCIAWLHNLRAWLVPGLAYDLVRTGQHGYRLYFAQIEDEL